MLSSRRSQRRDIDHVPVQLRESRCVSVNDFARFAGNLKRRGKTQREREKRRPERARSRRSEGNPDILNDARAFNVEFDFFVIRAIIRVPRDRAGSRLRMLIRRGGGRGRRKKGRMKKERQ